MKILSNIPEFKASEINVAEEVIDCYLRDPIKSGYHVLVAEIDATITGYICYGPTPLTESTWDIYWEVVEREMQGRGIGSALMEYTEEKIVRDGGKLVIIETSSTPAYEKTRRFHLKNGYTVICRISDFYAPMDDKLIFQKRLG